MSKQALNARSLVALALSAAVACGMHGTLCAQSQEGASPPPAPAGEVEEASPSRQDFEARAALGRARSRYLASQFEPASDGPPGADLATFKREIEPILVAACINCHGPNKAKGGVRIDELDPDLVQGEDVDWWLDVQAVLTNGEMPPPGAAELTAEERGKVIEWLSTEVRTASIVRRGKSAHTALRRMTRYEYEYALQDLLGLPFRFAEDLPPDPISKEGFQNSAELLHLSPMQLEAYFQANRSALDAATVEGDRPAVLYWSLPMEVAARAEFARQDAEMARVREQHAAQPAELEAALKRLREQRARRPGGVHYESLVTGRLAGQSWHYDGAKFAWAPTEVESGAIEVAGSPDLVAVIPEGRGMIVELGERLPDEGTLRVRVLASRATAAPVTVPGPVPSLRLDFGWQASNDSSAVVRTTAPERTVVAGPAAPELLEFAVPLREVNPRNWVRKTAKMGDLPSPSEYIKLVNSGLSGGPIRIHHVEVAAPVYDAWPPASHVALFPARDEGTDEAAYAKLVIGGFMERAWRRAPSPEELQRKLDQFDRLRAESADFQSASLDVLATVLTSPHFLFVGVRAEEPQPGNSDLATRLALFLWCSTPDPELLALAERGALEDEATLLAQVERMLADPRAERFARHFVRQWLGLALLDYLAVDQKLYPQFGPELKDAMAREPIAFFAEVLAHDLSALEFLHADFTMADERLARHYGLEGVNGNRFQRAAISADPLRGGLLTQAGLLAMNSDGKDSHPLKRGVWLLERLLDDPPPPPPPAVPTIDLADPEIAKMTIKERIEDHRNDPACITCHAKIDPWGIAFENYDAVGLWRTEAQGRPVDSSSVLFNGEFLDGMAGLKGFLLENRQDQFVRALVHKLTLFALGRPLSFEDRAAVEEITAEVRRAGDGLATMVKEIVRSELFRSE